MRILFLPFAAGSDTPGILTRAVAREVARRLGGAGDLEAVFRPFVHVVEGRRVFGVYGSRWSKSDLARLVLEEPAPDFLVHGDLVAGDPFRITVEVQRVPELTPVAERTFEAPGFEGFRVMEGVTRFVLECAEAGPVDKDLAEFPARTFEAYLMLLEGREAAASLDAWGDTAEPGEAFEPFLRALDREPGMEAAKAELCLLAAAAALGGTAPLPDAERAVRRLLESDRDFWRGWAALAQVQVAAADSAAAVESFEKALTIEPGRASLRYDLGMTYLRQGRTGRAAKTLETVKSDPRFGGEALLELGAIRAAKGDLDGAIELWRESVEKDPDRALAFANLGSALVSKGEFEEAESAFRRGLEARRPSWALHLGLGTHLAEQGRHGPAIEQLRTVLRLKPTVPGAHLHIGRCYAAQGRRQPALHHLRKAFRGPDEVSGAAREALADLSAVQHEEAIARALTEATERSPEEQRVLLKEVLRVEAGFAEARIRLGLACIAEGRARAAEGHFRKVLKVLPDDAEAWSGLATALKARRKLKAAVDAHREAIERAPTHAAYHLNLADTLLRLDRIDEAAREIDAARTLEPHHPLIPGFVVGVKQKLSQSLEKAGGEGSRA